MQSVDFFRGGLYRGAEKSIVDPVRFLAIGPYSSKYRARRTQSSKGRGRRKW